MKMWARMTWKVIWKIILHIRQKMWLRAARTYFGIFSKSKEAQNTQSTQRGRKIEISVFGLSKRFGEIQKFVTKKITKNIACLPLPTVDPSLEMTCRTITPPGVSTALRETLRPQVDSDLSPSDWYFLSSN